MFKGKSVFKAVLVISAFTVLFYTNGISKTKGKNNKTKNYTELVQNKKMQQEKGQKSQEGKTAGEFFKNIKVLKNIPASRLLPTMHFFEASLGMNCGNCHVRDREKGWEFDKDNKPEKRKARKMIEMMEAINKNSFKGHQEVTCFTCHRGNPDPDKIPAVQTLASLKAEKAREALEDNIIKVPNRLNTAEEIINRYVAKIGGKAKFKEISTLKFEGNIDENGRQASVVIYRKAPDYFISSIQTPRGEMQRGYNGKTGWEKFGTGTREIKGDNLEELKLESEFYLPIDMLSKYSDLKLNDVSVINGDTVYVVDGKASEYRNIKLYFNTKTGLLQRQVLLNRTPLGYLPVETDFKDYRSVNGILLPFSVHTANYEHVQDVKFDNISANLNIENSRFDPPAK